MTNDEYQREAREQRRLQDEQAFSQNIANYERQQREQRQQQEEARRSADMSRRLGRAGAIPPIFGGGGYFDSTEYQEGLWEHQAEQRAKKAKEEDSQPFITPTARQTNHWDGTAWPIEPISAPRRSWRLIGGITSFVVDRVWPLSMLRNWGEEIREAGRMGKAMLSFIFGCAFALLINLPQIHSGLAQQFSDSPEVVYVAAFYCGAVLGWITPAIIGSILVGAAYVTGIVVEVGIYTGIVLGVLWAIKTFQ